MDRSTIDSYCQYYVGLNPLALRGASTPGAVRTSDVVISEAEFRDTEFYHGWYKPRGWLHSAAVILDRTETERALLYAVRPPNHPFTEKERAILKPLAAFCPGYADREGLCCEKWIAPGSEFSNVSLNLQAAIPNSR